ncbi:MATE family efflux transporter [Caldimonas thermodepolymerans]|uniref:Multidrug-efflux transporter n=1 Tax=Caldimonas thermodepolymerans TaxID=215580 RepID=A0A2S5T1F3_9BURK|nr:MATE family efflux transporter [Caldimonas thermodepolymerans]PPE68772.1 MATE family efflux transporter [Caldimonas thermodepolymerans]QPC30390.1 MATE family efflux transporter [Caldimonas thermodepolymerans]RDH95653.1 MATE family multidrug resistance protein [Caldimonas thermodepolymerans]TCP03650.1 MATE family multidrug resistance protein [Caldimonas thermodepolymerans]UZG46821.1 MATE family efflux transporter [Caldimonas thermodepolymerans]
MSRSFSAFLAESRALVRLATPIVLSQVAYVLMGLTDTVMSGHAGAAEQAIVGLGVALWMPVFIGLMSVVQAVSPVVAHHYGAGDRAGIVADTREGVWLAAFGSLLPFALLPLVQPLLLAAGIEPPIAAGTAWYLWGVALGMPAALVFRAIGFYSASINHPRPLMVLAFVGLVVNTFLNWVLIYGHLGMPAMGGAGCGWATGISMWVGLVGLVIWTARGRIYKPYYLWDGWSWPTWRGQKQLLRIGLPMGGAGLAEVAAFSGIAVLVGRFGAVQIAAHQVALNFSALIFMLPMGLSSALSIRVGHRLGAGDPRGARFVAWTGIGLGLLIAATAIGPIVAGRHLITELYSNDTAVRQLAATLLLFAALWQFFDATQVCAIGALRGYKVTFVPMLMMLVAFWGVGIPLGAWLGYVGLPGGEPLQVYGFWIGLVVGLVLVSVAFSLTLRVVSRTAIEEGRGSAVPQGSARVHPGASGA